MKDELLKIKKKLEIKKWLDENIDYDGQITINDDLTIDVDGGIALDGYTIKELPSFITFGRVDGHFSIGANPIVSTRGFPRYCKSAGVKVSPYGPPLEKPDWCECEQWCNDDLVVEW